MDPQVLKQIILSENNIAYLVEFVRKRVKLSEKSIPKCVKIIKDDLEMITNRLENHPTNNQELEIAIDYLNRLCYNNFITYLISKYPGQNLSRDGSDMQSLYITEVGHEIENVEDVEEEIEVIDKNQRDALIKQYGIASNKSNINFSTPEILAIFYQMSKLSQKYEVNYEFEDIIEEDEVRRISDANRTVKQVETPKKSVFNKTIDLTKDITSENIKIIEEEMQRITVIKAEFLDNRDFDTAAEIDEYKDALITKIIKFKKEQEEKIKIAKIESASDNSDTGGLVNDENDSGIEYLNLVIDPSEDHNNMKNILFKCKAGKKIEELQVIKYYLPKNPNNVTRFNNIFAIYTNEKVVKVTLPTAEYSIEEILEYISRETTLKYSIADKRITLKADKPFDIILSDDSIFPLLGFSEDANKYKEKMEYTAARDYHEYNSNSVILYFNGTSIKPITLETDKKVEEEKVLKKVAYGFILREFKLGFMTQLDGYYDFTQPLNICFKIIYLK